MIENIAIVTGANAGLGFETAKELANLGFRVVMACRDLEKGLESKVEILKENDSAIIDVLYLDLSKQKSVSAFADLVKQDYKRIDSLINNAGIMMTPYKQTEDGFESQLATNYLGHFALTAYLLPLLIATQNSRVVSLSSLAHRWSSIRFEDVNFEKSYDTKLAYGQSKFACLMFAYELDRRFKAAGIQSMSLAAHPGLSNTGLFQSSPLYFKLLSPLIGQSAENGTKPSLYAATASELKGGEYIGPGGFQEWRGEPKIVDSNEASKNRDNAKKLWDLSEQLTSVKYNFTS